MGFVKTNLYIDDDGMSAFPLGMMQKSMLGFELRNRGSMNFGYAIRIQGELDPNLVRKAIQRMINDNDAMRLVLAEKQGENYQFSILKKYNVELVVVKCPGSNMEEKLFYARSEIKQKFEKPMDLWNDILVKPFLYKLADSDYIVVMKFNHLVTDGTSMLLTIDRMAKYMFQPDYRHSDKTGTYIEYIQEEQNALKSPNYEISRLYWKEMMDGYEDYNMPSIHERVDKSSQQLGEVIFEKQLFTRYIKENKVSIFLVIMLAYHITLMKIFNRTDTALTYVVSNRMKKKFSNMLGLIALFCNSRNKANGSDKVTDVLKDLKSRIRASDKHTIMSMTQPNLDFVLSYQPVSGKISDIESYKLEMFMTSSVTDHKLSMFLVNVYEIEDKILLSIACDLNLYGEHLCIAFLKSMEIIVCAMLEDSDITMREVLKKISDR